MEQCTYYGLSLGRIGVDFRGLFHPLFIKTIFNLFSNSMTASTHYFIETLKTYKFFLPPKQLAFPFIDSKDPYSPPAVLLNYPPLAVLTNGYLSALNELRYCAPMAMQQSLSDILSKNLLLVTNHLNQFHKEPPRKLEKEEEVIFSAMCQVNNKIFFLVCLKYFFKQKKRHIVNNPFLI